MSPRTETAYKADEPGKVAQRIDTHGSGSEVNAEVAQLQFAFSSGEAHGDGLRFAADCDLKSFFDTVNHGLLLNRLARRVKDPRVLRLISRYLHAGVVLPDGKREATACGVPQGGPLSPLAGNSIVQRALTKQWLWDQGVPNMRQQWVDLHYPAPLGVA